MKTLLKSRIILGVMALLAFMLVAGGLSFTTAYAQGPTQGGTPPTVVLNNQAVLDLLKTTQNDLYQLRLSGKSWLDIAASKGVSETALVDALLKPINDRHVWMSQTYPQFNAAQMTEYMRTQFTNDIRVTQFGTIADRHVFGGVGMMGGWNNNYGFGGGMRGGGMMGYRTNGYGFGNGYGGGMRGGGMMGGWNTLPNVTPVPAK